MEQRISETMDELRTHPGFGQWADWALRAKAICLVTESHDFIDGKCQRCSAPDPNWLQPRSIGAVAWVGDRSEPAGCPAWTQEQGCPLHGESCTGGRS